MKSGIRTIFETSSDLRDIQFEWEKYYQDKLFPIDDGIKDKRLY